LNTGDTPQEIPKEELSEDAHSESRFLPPFQSISLLTIPFISIHNRSQRRTAVSLTVPVIFFVVIIFVSDFHFGGIWLIPP
jgi:hypothetical protein